MTAVLGCLVLFIYSVISNFTSIKSTFSYVNDEEIKLCENILECFLSVIDLGLRTGGGIGEALIYTSPDDSDLFLKKVTFNLTFFIVINVIILNICFGIIIDTFAELRDVKRMKGNF